MRVVRLGFAKLSTYVLDLAKPRAEGGRASRDKGGETWFCKTEHLSAQFGKTEGRGEITLVEMRMVRLGFAKPSTYVLNLAKLRVEEEVTLAETRVARGGRTARNEAQSGKTGLQENRGQRDLEGCQAYKKWGR